MKIIDSLTADPQQSMRIVLDDGSKFDLTLTYKELQSGWFYSIVYGTTMNIQNRRLVGAPNFLRAFRNIVPFGLACIVDDGYEPIYVDDFKTGRASIYILNQSDMLDAESVISGYAND